LRQARLPGIERVAGLEKPGAAVSSAKGRNHEQSREEIIERLVNPTITLEEAAKIMGVCKATVRRYTVKGILPHYRTAGNQRRFKLNDIINFLENQRK
jgi:excisionase family DNA binding protein